MSIATLAQQTRERVTTHSSRVLLMIVPQATEGVQATQKYFAKFLSFVAVVGFLALLGVHTLLAQDAFVLSELKLESKMIADQREAISRKMEMYSSPQALANQAPGLALGFMIFDQPLQLWARALQQQGREGHLDGVAHAALELHAPVGHVAPQASGLELGHRGQLGHVLALHIEFAGAVGHGAQGRTALLDAWLAHARDYVRGAQARYGLGPHSCVVEVAANDGYLLQYVAARGIHVDGVGVVVHWDPPADAKDFDGETGKYEKYFSPEPGQGD